VRKFRENYLGVPGLFLGVLAAGLGAGESSEIDKLTTFAGVFLGVLVSTRNGAGNFRENSMNFLTSSRESFLLGRDVDFFFCFTLSWRSVQVQFSVDLHFWFFSNGLGHVIFNLLLLFD
jgi:hypothetical protein